MKTEKKSGADRSQPAVTNEEWSDERVREFLELESTAEDALDFHLLLRAYRGMVPETFGRFVRFFVEDGRDINEPNRHGETILDIVSRHRNSGEYAQMLREAGARLSTGG